MPPAGKRESHNFRLTYSTTRIARIVATAAGIIASRNKQQIIYDTTDMLHCNCSAEYIFGITDFVIFW